MSEVGKRNAADRAAGLKRGQRVAFAAALVTLALAILKGATGHLFQVKILVADALHSSADALAVFASGFGLMIASGRKSRRFPYGLYKAETLVSLVIGMGILLAGAMLLKDGWERLFQTAEFVGFPALPVGVSLLSMAVAYLLARKEKSVGRLINSQSLVANANESFLDIISSLVVLAGIILAYFRIPFVEGAVIILISLLVVKLGLENLWTSLLILMDANLDPDLQLAVEEKINKIYGVKGVSDVRIRQAGPFRMVECEIQTRPTLPLHRAHELADRAENFIMENFEHIESVFIHLEPVKEGSLSAIIPVADINGLESRVHGHFGRAPYFIIVRISGGETIIEDFYLNAFLDDREHVGLKVVKAVIGYRLDLLFTPRVGEIAFHALKSSLVDIYRVEEGFTVREVVERYLGHQLDQIVAPTHTVEQSKFAERTDA